MPEAYSAFVEELASAAYDTANPDDSFKSLERRAAFSKEAAGLYRDWMRAALSGALNPAQHRLVKDSRGQADAIAA